MGKKLEVAIIPIHEYGRKELKDRIISIIIIIMKEEWVSSQQVSIRRN